MKKMYKKEEGVSPVIATILMVAITVVLAATVWLMVSGYMGTSQPALQGTLQYNYQNSKLGSDGWVNLTALISQPNTGLNPNDVNLLVNGTKLTYTSNTPTTTDQWTFIDNDGNGKLSNGDIIVIHAAIYHGSTVSVGAKGYSGSISITIP